MVNLFSATAVVPFQAYSCNIAHTGLGVISDPDQGKVDFPKVSHHRISVKLHCVTRCMQK